MTSGGKNKCIFCKTVQETGITILTAFICLDCERKIVFLCPDDSRYSSYIKEIKSFLKGLQDNEESAVSVLDPG